MRARQWRLLAVLWLGTLVAFGPTGCRRSGNDPDNGTEESAGGEESAPPQGWPRVLVVGPGTGPALYLGAEQNAPAVGYLNPGVRIRLESSPSNGRIEVLVAGRLATKAWIPLNRVAAYAQQRGRVQGTRAYLGPNDLVTVMGPNPDEEGQMRVEVRPWFGGANFLDPVIGTFATDGLGSREVDENAVEGPTAGECYRLPIGQTVPLYERPGGTAVANLPALDPPAAVAVLRQQTGWFGVRAGHGPYLTGYIQAALTPCVGEFPEPEPMVPAGDGERPYWMSQERGNLHRVASGTRIRFHGRTIARLRTEGWAREIRRQGDEGQVDVFVAVDDSVALRGLVDENALTLVERGEAVTAPDPAPPSGATPEQPTPAENVPDELQ